MFYRKAYAIILSFYPASVSAQFAGEMIAVFEQAAADHRSRGKLNLFLFFIKEIGALLAGAIKERISPRCTGTRVDPELPSDLASAEAYLQVVSARLIHAIANHDFAGARHYDALDRTARNLIAQFRRQANEFGGV